MRELAALPLGYAPTWGTDALREAIAATYETVTPDDVLVFAGAEEAMFWALQELVGPGDHAIVTVPNYQSIGVAAARDRRRGLRSLAATRGRLGAGLRRAHRAAPPDDAPGRRELPQQPDRRAAGPETWAALVALCDERGIRLFSDEVYRGLEPDGTPRLRQAADASPTALSLGVMSKAYGLPGLRIGWLACRDRSVLQRLETRKHYTTICNPGPSELIATHALRRRDEITARNRAIIARNLPIFDAFFAAHADLFEWEHPQAGCVCFPRYRGADGVEAFCRDLVAAGGRRAAAGVDLRVRAGRGPRGPVPDRRRAGRSGTGAGGARRMAGSARGRGR